MAKVLWSRSPKKLSFYLSEKTGDQATGVVIAQSKKEPQQWAAHYEKSLEAGWKDFALKTFQKHCPNCHAVDTKAAGPALKGLLGKTQTVLFTDGSKKEMTIDADYLHKSIVDPMSFYAEGSVPAMPKLPLSEREVKTLVRWIQEL